MKIYIVRHGETYSNKAKKAQGQRINESLNSEGIRQAEELTSNIDKDFDVIFTSPLKRAAQTAEILAKEIKAPVIVREEIIERDYGSLSGKTWEEMFEFGEGKIDFRKMDFELEYDYRPYGGECAEDVKKRLLKFIEELKKDYSDKKVLIIAHGGILKMAHFLFLEEKVQHTPKNASIYEFDI
jgi:probable phosphoglycerate mutase